MRLLLSAEQGHLMALLIAASLGIIQSSRLVFLQSESIFLQFLAGGLAGVAGLYLFGWLTRNFGRWFGAGATQRDVRIALGFGVLPWTLTFVTVAILLEAGVSDEVIAGYISFISILLAYGCVVLLLSLSAALQLSVIKTFLCMIVTALFSVFPLTLLAQLLVGLIGESAR